MVYAPHRLCRFGLTRPRCLRVREASPREERATHPTHIVQTLIVSLFSTLAVCRRIGRACHTQPSF